MSIEKSQLFIPSKIKVGFDKREGTYTGKLAYVIYYDNKNVLRKEKSWESWRDKTIDPVEMNNEPFDGFVLNKGVGGTRESYGWNARNEYIRVFDSRGDGFEFEISVANLLFILRECNCMKGKGLEGKFVYAWDGTELVLLPTNSAEYKNSKEFTSLQSNVKIKMKDLIAGATYITKKQETLIYLGKFDYYQLVKRNRPETVNYYNEKEKLEDHCVKRLIFYSSDGKLVALRNTDSLSQLQSDCVVGNYADLVDKYNKSNHGSKVIGFKIEEKTESDKDSWRRTFFIEKGGEFYSYYYYDYSDRHIYNDKCFFIKDAVGYYRTNGGNHVNSARKENKLIALLESGSEIDIEDMELSY
jgi:hypothetical protein